VPNILTRDVTPTVEDRDGRKALVVGGYIQSIAVNHDHAWDVWDAFIPRRRLPWNVLILGAGGGTIATLLTQRCGPIAITAIEIDPAVIALAQIEFGVRHLTNVNLIAADAFAWIETCTAAYDLICVDMYVAGEIAHGILATPFLRQIERLLIPGGTATFNLFKTKRLQEQVHRLSRVFTIAEQIAIGGNVVVHALRN